MTEQRRSEIIKSLAYGLDIKFAAECNDVTTEEVGRLADECKDEISAKRAELMEVHPDAF